LVTSSTLSSSTVLKKIKLKKTVHQFFPIDTSFLSKKFLDHWKPSLAIFIESEIWPNMILNLKKKSIPLLLLNARITKKSFDRWNSISSLSRDLFGSFEATYPQNIETKKYLKTLGVKKIKTLGNLKFAENEINKSNNLNKNIKNFFKSKKITKEIEDLGLNYHNHSSKNKIKNSTEIYLVDTYGETKSFFKICKTVFLGGSIIPHGGQNPLESIRFGCNIIHGPNIDNFKEIYALLKNNKISRKIYNSNQLVKALDKSFIKNVSYVKKIKKLKKIGSKILDNTYREVEYYIKKK